MTLLQREGQEQSPKVGNMFGTSEEQIEGQHTGAAQWTRQIVELPWWEKKLS